MTESGFNWFERVIGTFTFWAILGNVLVVVLEMIPLLGTIFAALLGVTRLAFVLPHLVTVALVLDVKTRQLRWPLLLIPVFIYVGYYLAYFHQQSEIAAYAALQRDKNPALVMQYDPAAHDLVFTDSRDEARALVRAYKAPVTYLRERNTPKSFRPISSALCDDMRAAGVYKQGWGDDQPRCDFINYYSRKDSKISPKLVRILEWFEKPSGKPIEISTEDPEAQKDAEGASLDLRVKEKIYRFSYEGREVGRFVTASYIPLPVVPAWAYVCFTWERVNCGGTFYSNGRKTIDTFPEELDVALYGDNPIGGLLGIASYADKAMSDFLPFPETEAIGRDFIEKKKNEKPEDYNEWGTRKDDPRLPVIAERNGVPSYEGGIYVRQLGGPFYRFIKDNEGKTVYIDARLDGNGNPGNQGFGLYGVCREPNDCGRIDHRYRFTNGGGAEWNAKALTVKGFWRIGPEEKAGEEDTKVEMHGIEAPE